MPINTLATATIFMTTLDKVAQMTALTGYMEANAGQVIYNGGDEVKIPSISLDGLADYDRDNGYTQGAVSLKYQTKRMTQDRGRKFRLDAMDVNETNFVATATGVMGQFQTEKVVPEMDAYRLSAITTQVIKAANTVGSVTSDMVEYGYTASESNVLRKIKEGIKKIRAKGFTGELVIHATPDVTLELETAIAGKIKSVTFAQGGIDTQVPAVDGVPIIETPNNLMVSAITVLDGKTSGQTKGGFTKAASGLNVNFIVLPKTAPIAVSKQDKMRIFDPENNQSANAWDMDYRRFHDLWIKDNAIPGFFVNIKDAKPAE